MACNSVISYDSCASININPFLEPEYYGANSEILFSAIISYAISHGLDAMEHHAC